VAEEEVVEVAILLFPVRNTTRERTTLAVSKAVDSKVDISAMAQI
jgi:hypothetical protein